MAAIAAVGTRGVTHRPKMRSSGLISASAYDDFLCFSAGSMFTGADPVLP